MEMKIEICVCWDEWTVGLQNFLPETQGSFTNELLNAIWENILLE